jgi:hypothetical protein
MFTTGRGHTTHTGSSNTKYTQTQDCDERHPQSHMCQRHPEGNLARTPTTPTWSFGTQLVFGIHMVMRPMDPEHPHSNLTVGTQTIKFTNYTHGGEQHIAYLDGDGFGYRRDVCSEVCSRHPGLKPEWTQIVEQSQTVPCSKVTREVHARV